MPVFTGYMKVTQKSNAVVAKNGSWLQGVKVQGGSVWLPSAEKRGGKEVDDLEFLQIHGTGPTIPVDEAEEYALSILRILRGE